MRKTYCVKVEMNYQRFFDAFKHILYVGLVSRKTGRLHTLAIQHLHACGLNDFNKSPFVPTVAALDRKKAARLPFFWWIYGMMAFIISVRRKQRNALLKCTLDDVYNYEHERSFVLFVKGDVYSTWN